jgi:hypothetical protein
MFCAGYKAMNEFPQLKLFITNQREFFPHYMGEGIDFVYISEVINEKVIEYTHDHQKQFIGEYCYRSSSFHGYEAEEANKAEELHKNNPYIIAIDDSGFFLSILV